MDIVQIIDKRKSPIVDGNGIMDSFNLIPPNQLVIMDKESYDDLPTDITSNNINIFVIRDYNDVSIGFYNFNTALCCARFIGKKYDKNIYIISNKDLYESAKKYANKTIEIH